MSKLVNSFQQAPSFQHALTRRNVGEGREDVYRCVKEKIRLNIIGGALHQTIFKVEHDEMPSEIYRSAVCGSRIITASRDGCIYCVDVDQRRLPWSYQAISPRALFYDDFETIDFYITEDKEKLVCPSYAYERHKIDILRFEDGACLTSLMNVDALKVALVSGLIFNQQECIDGRKLFVWNTDGNEIADFKWENLPAFSCKPFSYDGRILISQDSQLISFDRNGAEIK